MEDGKNKKRHPSRREGLPVSGRRLLSVFLSTLYLSAFTFGGGYVIITLLKKKFVDTLGWIDEEKMLDLVAIAQSAPGAIAVNGAIVVGYKIAGFPGIVCAVFGAILPPFLIITAVSSAYVFFEKSFIIQSLLKGMSVGVGAVILSVSYDMFIGVTKAKDALLLLIMGISFAAVYFFHVNVMVIILCCAVFGIIRTIFHASRKGEET